MLLPDRLAERRVRTDDLRRRRRRGRGDLDRLARVLPPGRVSAATRDRVLAVAAELGYRPNPHARALLSGRHHTVAMVVSDITNPHYFELIRGAEMRARVSEYTLLLVNAEESPRVEWEQIQRLVAGGRRLRARGQPAARREPPARSPPSGPSC